MQNSYGFEKNGSVPVCPSGEILKEAFSAYILSPSGIRNVFSIDKIEESASPAVSSSDAALTIYIAGELVSFIKEITGISSPVIALGSDTRPTGPALTELMIRSFLAGGADVNFLGIAAAPEIMAYAGLDSAPDTFAYISASHNPIGHNGFKFGWESGIFDPDTSEKFIDRIRKGIDNVIPVQAATAAAAAVTRQQLENVINRQADNKAAALQCYTRFTKEVFSGESDIRKQEQWFCSFRSSLLDRRIGIAADLNGSARTLSIDKSFLTDAGLTFRALNSLPGQIVHRIVPEGSSLEPCRLFLEDLNRKESFLPQPVFFPFGYTPDNDGDRGNIVYMLQNRKSAAVLEAQQLFALCVLSELASLAVSGCSRPIAVAVNCCTSERIDAIASVFGAKVFRAEVGEANVVNLAIRLQKEGYMVRILGEGSNGGNITSPATVRDPLNTIGSLLKLLTKPELFRIWCERTGCRFTPDETLESIIETLPPYTTTGAYEPQAKITIKTDDHAALKTAYEKLFPECWENQLRPLRSQLGLVSWKEFNYEKTEEKEGIGPAFRSPAGRGGFKIRFYDADQNPCAFVWMRGSGTEPVFRIMAEVKGKNPEAEAELLRIHTSLILEADRLCR